MATYMTYIFLFIGIICIASSIKKNISYSNNYNKLKLDVYSFIDKNINSPYILKIDVNKDNPLKLITVEQKISKKRDPIYIGDNYIKFPIGGGESSEKREILNFHLLDLPDVDINPDIFYKYYKRLIKDERYLMHSDAIKYFKKQFDKDISIYKFNNEIITIKQYEVSGSIYLYGVNGDKFTVGFASDNLDTLIKKVTYKNFWDDLAFGVVFMIAAVFFW